MHPPTLLALLGTSFTLGRGAAVPVLPAQADVVAARAQKAEPRQTSLINAILDAIVSIFPVNVAITDLTSAIGDAEQLLADTLGVSTTDNGLSSSCADVTVVFARGTTEAGNVGLLAGPPFFDALQSAIGSGTTLAVQGVDYPASIAGFLVGGDPTGSQTMANDVTKALADCPSTKLVMSGYSQGGQLVHNAAKLLPAATTAKVSAVVIFGDPDDGQAVQGVSASKVLVICHSGDNICAGGDLILLPHLTYAENAVQAADFVAAIVG